jgi:hypothetical protein
MVHLQPAGKIATAKMGVPFLQCLAPFETSHVKFIKQILCKGIICKAFVIRKGYSSVLFCTNMDGHALHYFQMR